jgi:exodeoxyribonuclease VII small subunit
MLKPTGRMFKIDDYPCSIFSANKIVIRTGLTKPIMAKKNFENALTRLEQITDELEAGDLSLEKSLDKFNEGIALVQFCNSRLEEAKSRVELLLKKDGDLIAVPFAEEDGGHQNLSE